MRLWLNVNKNLQICSGIKYLIGIWVRCFLPLRRWWVVTYMS